MRLKRNIQTKNLLTSGFWEGFTTFQTIMENRRLRQNNFCSLNMRITCIILT